MTSSSGDVTVTSFAASDAGIGDDVTGSRDDDALKFPVDIILLNSTTSTGLQIMAGKSRHFRFVFLTLKS